MGNNIRLSMSLDHFFLSPTVKQKRADLVAKCLRLEMIPQNGDFREYVRYVSKNKNLLSGEHEYVKRVLKTGASWGEILIVKNRDNQVIASFGPNRIKKEGSEERAMPGYLFVLPHWRGLGIGTILWNIGVMRMKKGGADFIRCSVEPDNSPALKIYKQMGMQMTSSPYPISHFRRQLF